MPEERYSTTLNDMIYFKAPTKVFGDKRLGGNIMKKKLLSFFLVGMLTTSMVAGCGKTEEENSASEQKTEEAGNADETEVTYSNKQIIIGDNNETSGDIQPHWTNSASDYSVYKLCYGQDTVVVDKEGKWVYNEAAMENVEETENEDGSKTWTYTIKDGLKWSNGDAITAKDYVFYYLFWSSPVAQVDLKAASASLVGQYLKGYDAYASGETNTLEGIHLIDDKTFSITIDAQFLPYYYGKALTACYPEYMAGWVPADVTIEETENGAKFSDNFTIEHIGDTANEFRMHPTAFSGAYTLESYDENGYAYTLKKNEYYPGNYEGQKANIETVIYKYVTQDTMMDQLKTGAVDILLQCADGTDIEAGLDLVEEGGFDYVNYPRAGYGMISFKCNQGPTQFAEVRHAVAYLLDRDAFAQTFTGGHGIVVNGPYGSQQWMVDEYADEIDGLNSYSYSLDAAIRELENGGWVYNEDGSEYTGSGIRYKKLEDGTMMPLIIEWCSSENNSVSDLLVTSLQQNPDLEAAGMQINQTVVTFSELLEHYYDASVDNPYQMFNLATGFSTPYDPVYELEPDSDANHIQVAGEAGQKLYDLCITMNQTEEGDDEKYVENWFNFISYWNELLPEIPLYSNNYHDFFTDKVHDFEEDGYNWDVTKAILYTNVE